MYFFLLLFKLVVLSVYSEGPYTCLRANEGVGFQQWQETGSGCSVYVSVDAAGEDAEGFGHLVLLKSIELNSSFCTIKYTTNSKHAFL